LVWERCKVRSPGGKGHSEGAGWREEAGVDAAVEKANRGCIESAVSKVVERLRFAAVIAG